MKETQGPLTPGSLKPHKFFHSLEATSYIQQIMNDPNFTVKFREISSLMKGEGYHYFGKFLKVDSYLRALEKNNDKLPDGSKESKEALKDKRNDYFVKSLIAMIKTEMGKLKTLGIDSSYVNTYSLQGKIISGEHPINPNTGVYPIRICTISETVESHSPRSEEEYLKAIQDIAVKLLTYFFEKYEEYTEKKGLILMLFDIFKVEQYVQTLSTKNEKEDFHFVHVDNEPMFVNVNRQNSLHYLDIFEKSFMGILEGRNNEMAERISSSLAEKFTLLRKFIKGEVDADSVKSAL